MNRLLVLGMVTLISLASACSGEPDERSDEAVHAAYESAEDELSDASFEDVGDTTSCTSDCSGHDAGFEWAKEEGVTDSSECSGESDSFIEGCEAYATALDEQVDEEDQEDAGEDEPY